MQMDPKSGQAEDLRDGFGKYPSRSWRRPGEGGVRVLLLSLLFATPGLATPLPVVCEVISEEDPAISIRLEERTPTALRGSLIQDGERLGVFTTSKPKRYRQTTWYFFTEDAAHSGIALLFEDDLVWNPLKRVPKPQDANRVIFVGLDEALFFWRTEEFAPNRALLTAAAGFWKISSTCLGGRIIKG